MFWKKKKKIIIHSLIHWFIDSKVINWWIQQKHNSFI